MDNNSLGTIWAEIGIDYSTYDQAIKHVTQQNQQIDISTQQAMDMVSKEFLKASAQARQAMALMGTESTRSMGQVSQGAYQMSSDTQRYMTQMTEETKRSVDVMTANLDRIGKTLSIALTAPLTLLGRQWLNTFAGFEQGLANTRSVIGGTAQELESLTDAARQAGETTVFKASQAADALYNLGSAGMDAAQSIAALDGVLALAAATQADLAFASDAVASSLSQFSLEAEEAIRVANLFAAAAAYSQADLQKLADSMRYAGPVAHGFGLSIEETTAALMGMYDAGLRGEQSGTSLRNALQSLAAPTGDTVNVLNELKLSLNQVHPEINDLADIIDTLRNAGIDTTQTLRLFGQAAGPGMSVLIQAGGDSLREMTANITGTDEALKQAAMQIDNISGDLKMLGSNYESLVLTMTDNFEPALRLIVQRLSDMLGWLRDLNPEAQKLIVITGGFAAAAGPTLLIVNQLIKALPILFGPTGWIYAGVAAATALGLAMATGERDMREFYQTSIDNSRATRDQAKELRSLVDEYKALDGKPDKSEQEHKRLQDVMSKITEIQPELVKGYESIDEAIKANITTLETYIKTLETQSELELRVANLEFLRQRNQLAHELNRLEQERSDIRSRIDIDSANRIVNIASDAELAFLRFTEAIETGTTEAMSEAMSDMQRLLVEFNPDHMAGFQADRMSPWGIWIDQLRREAKRATADSTGLFEELSKINTRINEITDTIAHGEAVADELERRRLGITDDKPVSATPKDDSNKEIQEITRTTEELEQSLKTEMELYRAKIDLVRYAGDQYAEVYGSLEQTHQDYVSFLESNVYDRQLNVTEQFRASMAIELGRLRDDLTKLTAVDPEVEVDPDTLALTTMQVFNAELSLLRMGITQYEEELGGLQQHLSSYNQWLNEQLANTGLSAATHARIADTRSTIEAELKSLAEQSKLSAGEVWNKILGLTNEYGPLSGRLRNAVYRSDIKIDWSDLDVTQERIKNFYTYLVESGEITLDDQLAVVNHQIDRAVAGSHEWLSLWRDKLRIQEQITRLDADSGFVSSTNDALQQQLELFEQLKHANDDNVNTYRLQAEWLENNVLNAEGILQTERERRDIENEIFNLRMSHFRELSQAERWNVEEQISQLGKLVGTYATSFEQIRAVNQMQAELQTQLIKQQQRTDDERIRQAQEVSDKLLQLEIDRLRNLGKLKDAEILEEYARYQRDLRNAGDNTELQDIARQSYEERLRSLGIRDANEALKEAEELDYMLRANEIKRLQANGQFQEAEIQQANLTLTKKLNQYKGNQKMIEAAREEHEIALASIFKKFAEQAEKEQERKLAEQQKLDDQWQAFLIESRQLTQQSVLAIQIRTLEQEFAMLEDGNERKTQLERELKQARFNLSKQELEDQRALLDALVLQEELSAEDRLDILARIREGYEELYGTQYMLSQEWQQIRQQEIALEEQVHKELAEQRIKELEVNNQSIASLMRKQQALLRLVDTTESYVEKQEYLNELLEVQSSIKDAQDQTLDFFTKVSPKVGGYTKQLLEMNKLIRQSPQAFDNMRISMNQMFGDYGDGLAALYGALSGYSGAGGDIPGILAGISGAVAGFAGDPIFSMIASGISLIGQLFDPGPIPQDAQTLSDSIDKINDSLEEFGVAYRSAQLAIEKEKFLGFLWQTGWKITGEEAAKAGYEIGQAMLESMNTSLSSLGSAMGQAISGQATWDDFQKVLGQQLQRILLQEIMAAAEFEKQAKLIVGMMEETVSGGYSEEEINRIKDAWREIMDAAKQEWDQYSAIFDEMFPKDDTTVRHEVRGVQITRLAGQDRDMFAEMFRPLSVLDQLLGLLQPQMELFQEYQMGQIAQLHATQIIMENVYIERIERAEFHGNIQTLNVSGEALDESLDKKVRAMTDEAISRAVGSGN